MKVEKRVARRRRIAKFGVALVLGALSMACGSRVRGNPEGETGLLEANDTNAESTTVQGDVCVGGGCALTASATSGTTSSQSSMGAAFESCFGPGRYESGKEGSGRPCCEGLTEVLQLSPSRDEYGNLSCGQPLVRVYACVLGSCGDGVCEVGEDVPCGCAEDCPNTLSEHELSPTPTTTDSGEANAPCEDFACQVPLSNASHGELEIKVDFRGPFCSDSCGGVTPTVFHVETGLRVPSGRGYDCSECRVYPSNPICSTPEVSDRTWDGSIHAPDAVCKSDMGTDLACQTVARYAPPGRYRAQFCSFSTTNAQGSPRCDTKGEQRCESVEFDYPPAAPVAIVFDNTSTDAGENSQGTESDAGADVSLE